MSAHKQSSLLPLKAFFTVGSFTFLSRILGYVRDLLIAATVGTGPIAEAFFVAFRIPNMFRRIFAEGAFNAAFLPSYSRILSEEGQAGATSFARQTLGIMLGILIPFSLLLIWQMPLVIGLIAPGFNPDSSRYALAIIYARIMFAYLGFMAFTALFSAILQAHNRFAAAAAAPMLLNLFFIAALLIVLPFTGNAGLVMAWAVFVSGIAQVFLVIWAIRRQGLSVLRPYLSWNPRIKQLIVLIGPGILSAGIWQINTFINTVIASTEQGAVAFLYYADRLYQLPLGLIGVAFGVVLLPSLSRALRAGDEAKGNIALSQGVELSSFFTFPAMIAMLIIPQSLCLGLFERGDFMRSDTLNTAQALFMLGLGVPAAVLVKVFMPGFYARQDTKTPMFHAAIAVLCNISLALLLFSLLKKEGQGFIGLAAATTCSGWVMAFLQAKSLLKRGFWQPKLTPLLGQLGRSFAASLLMASGLYIVQLYSFAHIAELDSLTRFIAVLILSFLGLLIYLIAAWFLKVQALRLILARFIS